jgi:ABC-type arginine transport system ATPase subunit
MKENPQVAREDVERTVRTAIEMHVRGHVAPSKASQQWKKILQQLPADMVADILALELSTGKYQSVPMCEHCGR